MSKESKEKKQGALGLKERWSARRKREVVLRRRLRGEEAVKHNNAELGQTERAGIELREGGVAYEYAVLVTSLADPVQTLAQHYRDRAGAENVYDELKNQWGWGGYIRCFSRNRSIMKRQRAFTSACRSMAWFRPSSRS